ncbi:MAG: N-acetylmannosamine kinase, partial [Oscillospiraceae bacterium]|nr:N-acetylmannosamine kinase [Oscillospiraceae bacterium]
ALIVALGRAMNRDLSATFGALEQIWDTYQVYAKEEDLGGYE